jgi:TRAP-type C4-dicarboxylate transport system permease small subunit
VSADPHQPSFPRIRRLDAAWYRAERAVCGVMFLAMALVVFASVLRDVFGTRHRWTDAVVLFAFAYAAVVTRVRRDGEPAPGRARAAATAGVITVAVAAAVELYVRALPGGFVWAPKLALCMMLWVSLLGASTATYEKAHLAVELGERLWPRRVARAVKAFAHAVTSLFCAGLLWLSVRSLIEHHHSWTAADGFADTVPSIDWLPQWAVFLIFPYVFGAMAVRLLAQTHAIATGTDVAAKEQLPT